MNSMLFSEKRMQTIWRDIRYGGRMLAKRPDLTWLAVMTPGLGIGVNTTLFSGFNLLARPTQIKNPDAFVKIEVQSEDVDRDFSDNEYVYYRDHTQTLSDVLPTSEEWIQLKEERPDV